MGKVYIFPKSSFKKIDLNIRRYLSDLSSTAVREVEGSARVCGVFKAEVVQAKLKHFD